MLDDTRTVEACTCAASDQPIERFSDTAFGTVTWQTLFTGDRTPTDALTCGLAHLEVGDYLALHRHVQPEIYFGVSGTARVMIDGVAHVIAAGVAVFIPGGAVHGIFADTEATQFFYAFACDTFGEVEYQFLPGAAPELAQGFASEAGVELPTGDDMPDLIDMPGAFYQGDYPVQ
jgi:quercetin dioxygenase-like cupin family protein